MKQLLFIALLFFSGVTQAKLRVVATTADIQAITRAVGGDLIELTSIAKGSSDPHFLEAKPSFMIKLRDADLLISNGLSLEIGWLPSLIRGSHNAKMNPGSSGHLDLGALVEPLEKPTGDISRSMGDVHPDGNPHYTLDPIRVGELAQAIAKRMGELDSGNAANFTQRANQYQANLKTKVDGWRERLKKTGISEVITYHPSLSYFLARYGLKSAATLEAKPGVPPSAQHILEVIEIAKKNKIAVALVDNFFDTKIADRVAAENPPLRVKSVGISVDSAPGLSTIEDVQEELVKAIEGK